MVMDAAPARPARCELCPLASARYRREFSEVDAGSESVRSSYIVLTKLQATLVTSVRTPSR